MREQFEKLPEIAERLKVGAPLPLEEFTEAWHMDFDKRNGFVMSRGSVEHTTISVMSITAHEWYLSSWNLLHGTKPL